MKVCRLVALPLLTTTQATGNNIMNQIPKCTLVPARFFDETAPRCFLSEIFELEEDAEVEHKDVPQYDAVLVYEKTEARLPALSRVIDNLDGCAEYNKILADWKENTLSLAIAQGRNLLLANVFPAKDFITAEYHIFNALKSLQLNPEVSTVCFMEKLGEDNELSLYRYFKSVEYICV